MLCFLFVCLYELIAITTRWWPENVNLFLIIDFEAIAPDALKILREMNFFVYIVLVY